MGIIDRLGLVEFWTTNINDKSTPRYKLANTLVIGIMTIYLGYFLLVVLSIMMAVWFLIVFLKVIDISFLDKFEWLLYGLIFGIGFSFFVQAIPKKTGKEETPENIWKSFRHHFSYFWAFFTSVLIWGIIIMFVVFVYRAIA